MLGRNVCTPEEEAKCKEEIQSPKYLEWACENCKKKKEHQIHPWTSHILFLRRLMKARFPFNKNDLTLEEWLDMGFANEIIDAKKF